MANKKVNSFAILDEDYDSTVKATPVSTAIASRNMQSQRSSKPATSSSGTYEKSKKSNQTPIAQNSNWNKPNYDRNHNSGKKFANKENNMITKFYKIYEKIDKIMQTSSGNITAIENDCKTVFEEAQTKEEKAKTIEAIVSYSLHELISKDSFFGKLIASDMSINSKIGSIKERDGYDVFTWAIWTRINDKYFIRNIERNNSDIIKTVESLLQLNVSPFHINNKKESFVGTMNACMPKRITQETYNTIYNKIFVDNVNIDLLIECCKHNLPEIFREGNTFTKSIVQWGLSIPTIFDSIIKEAFTHDLDYAGMGDIDRKNCEIVYHQVYFPKLIELCNSESHLDLNKYFKENPMNKKQIINKIADYYMQSMFNSYESIYEHDINFGSAGEKRDGICFKKLETFGAFLWEIKQISNPIYFDQDAFNKMDIKVHVGYGIHGLNCKKDNIQFLKNLYPLTNNKGSLASKFLVMNVCDKFGIQLDQKIEKKEIVEEKKEINHFANFRIGLENIKNEIVEFEPKITNQSVDDAIYGMSKLSKKVTQDDFAKEFVIKAMYELTTDNQIKHIPLLINYLHNQKILNKGNIRSFIETDECQEVVEDSTIDNPKAEKLFSAIRESVY